MPSRSIKNNLISKLYCDAQYCFSSLDSTFYEMPVFQEKENHLGRRIRSQLTALIL